MKLSKKGIKMEMYDEETYYELHMCHHGNILADCVECDEEIGEIDKCLNCGRYKGSDQLNQDQVCKIPCRNPNEY